MKREFNGIEQLERELQAASRAFCLHQSLVALAGGKGEATSDQIIPAAVEFHRVERLQRRLASMSSRVLS